MKRVVQSSIIAAWIALSAVGHAQTEARAASLVLFEEAEKLAAAGDTATACRKYGESYSLDPQLQALLRWGECLEKEGKLASAYQAFQDAVELGQRTSDARWSGAEARARALRPRLSFITIEVPRERQISTLSVERDGFRLGSSAWGVPTPVDPGRHTIRASAFGYREWQTTIEINAEGAAPYVEVPMLERLPDVPASGPEPAAVVVAPASPPLAPAAPDVAAARPAAVAPPPAKDSAATSKLGATRIAALALGGAGVVGVGAGLYFLIETRNTLSERDGICPSSVNCEPGTNTRLAELTNQARGSQRAELICFGLAGAALGTGLALWFLPQGKQSTEVPRAALLAPLVHPGGGGLLLQGEL
jgi:hypothetical protein